MNVLLNYPVWILAAVATLGTYFMTALGAGMVFFFKTIHQKMIHGMLGFASGIMVAASFWSLLNPAIEQANQNGEVAWLTVAIGFLSGGLFLGFVSSWMTHRCQSRYVKTEEGRKAKRLFLLILSITLHNIPEGLAVGVAFGAIPSMTHPESALMAAIAIAIGIGIQNFPEGAAISIPMRQEGISRRRSFYYGQLSGIVEPIFGIMGALLVKQMEFILPYALSFAAGAMIYVVIEDLIPASHSDKSSVSVWGAMIGFTLMMILDVALG